MQGGQQAKLLREMQNRLLKIQQELGEATVEGTAGGGAVRVVMTGQQRCTAVEIAPEAVDPDDVELLQEMLVAAFNEALTKSQELAAQRLGALTGGMKIPGLF
ncbi:MAG TPA: YbaB/EbfC family nucleoid-associated protein [Chloroflexota bacterium]|jgi:DNA-binding YbaB/EbfC family protein|nr:YbaB/EbfC family nucleoid-associated protein [Chloroflexota bacterium]